MYTSQKQKMSKLWLRPRPENQLVHLSLLYSSAISSPRTDGQIVSILFLTLHNEGDNYSSESLKEWILHWEACCTPQLEDTREVPNIIINLVQLICFTDISMKMQEQSEKGGSSSPWIHSPPPLWYICHRVWSNSHEVIRTRSNLIIILLGMTWIDSH